MDQDYGVGREVKRLREAQRWSQSRLAVEAKMSVSGVSMIENGHRNLSTATLGKLAEAFGVGVGDLFPKGSAPSPEPTLFNGLEDERRKSAHQNAQNAWYDYVTQEADRIASEADRKGYAPDWMMEIAELPRKVARVLFDNGVLGKRDTYRTDAEWRQSWEISDALTELDQAVERAWRAQMRESEHLERRREAAAKLTQIGKRREADKDSKEARELEAIRTERSKSA